MGKLLFKRASNHALLAGHAEKQKRTKLHLYGIVGAIVGIIAAVGIILVLSQMEAEKQVQMPVKVEQKQNIEERPLCNDKGTYLFCMCLAGRDIVGTCSAPQEAASDFYTSPIAGGTIYGLYSSNYWRCSWKRMPAFAHFVPLKNLCGDANAQTKYCEEAAKTRPECNISITEKETIDEELQRCGLAAKNSCKGEAQSSDIREYIDASSMESGPIEETS